MNEQFQQLLIALQALPVDTARQQSLVRAAATGASHPAILVLGNEESDPLSLLPGGNPFAGMQPPACPIRCCHGPQFEIRVRDAQGAEVVYVSPEALHAQAMSVAACTVITPQADPAWPPLLFALPDGHDQEELRRLAAMTDGCIFTAYAEAGTVGEAAAEMSKFFPQNRCLLVLTHVENTFYPNDMLALQLHNGQLLCLECDHTLTGKGGPDYVLRSAMEMILTAPAQPSWAESLAKVRGEALALMEAHIRAAQDRQAQQLKAMAQYEEAEKLFRAEASTRRFEVRALLNDDLRQGLQKDLAAFVEALKAQLPAMIDEVVETSDKPKDALKYLLADYVSATLNDGVAAGLDELVDERCLPEMNRIMQETMDVYARLSTVALSSLTSEDADVQDDFIPPAHVQLGDFRTPLAHALEMTIRLLIGGLLGYLRLNWTIKYLKKILDPLLDLFTAAVDAVTPIRSYTKSISKAVVKGLDEISGMLQEQIGTSIFPRLVELLDEEYADFIDLCAKQLTQGAEHHRNLAAQAEEEIRRGEEAVNAFRQTSKGGN